MGGLAIGSYIWPAALAWAGMTKNILSCAVLAEVLLALCCRLSGTLLLVHAHVETKNNVQIPSE